LLLLSALVLCASAGEPVKWLMDEGLVIVEPVVFTEFIQEYNTSMVLFYGQGCGNCQWMMKDYKKAALQAKLQNLPVAFAKMNGQAHKDYTKNMGVTGFPHIHVFGPTKQFGYKYRGKMNAAAFIAELKRHLAGELVQTKRVVLDLTDKTFVKLIQQEASVVLFTDKNVKDTVERADYINDVALALQEQEIEGTIGVLDINKYPNVVNKSVSDQQILVYRENVTFPLPRSSDPFAMQKEITKHIYLSSVELDAESDAAERAQWMEGKNSDDVVMMLFPNQNASSLIYKKWIEFCHDKEEIKCAHTFYKPIIDSYNVTKMTIVWNRPQFYILGKGQKQQTLVQVPADTSNEYFFGDLYNEKVFKNQIPLVADHDMTTMAEIAGWQTKATVVCYFNVDYTKGKGIAKTKKMMKRIGEVAKKYWPMTTKGNEEFMIRFMIGDEIANQETLEKVKLGVAEPDDDPVVIIHNYHNHTMHAPSQDAQDNKDMSFEKYLAHLTDQWINGTLPVFYLSQEVPKHQTSPIATYVRSTLDKFMYDETKDVVIFFTKKDCSECDIILEWLKVIVKELKDEKDIVFGMIDVEQNDVDRDLFINTRAPKITMMPGGKKPERAISFPFHADIGLAAIRRYLGTNCVLALKSCPSAAPPPKASFGDIIGNDTVKAKKEKPKKAEL